MNRLSFGILASVLALLVAAPAARGQTETTPTPAPTVAATPVARDLLQRAYADQAAQGSVHYEEVVKFVTPKQSREVDATRGDISWRDGLMREYTTARITNLKKKPNPTRISKSTVLIANGRLASRTDKDKWDCSYANIKSSGSGSSSGDNSEDLSAIFQTARLNQTNLGLETLNGISVWHIRETMIIPGITPDGQPGLGDYYISQAEEIPLREVISLTMNMVDPTRKNGRMTIVQNSVMNYSLYGETFGVQVPKACRSKHVSAALRQAANASNAPLFRALTEARQRVSSS